MSTMRRLFALSELPVLHVGLDAVGLEVALREADRLGRDALALEVLDGLDLRVVRHGEDPAHRVARGLRVVELADLDHVAAVLVHPVVAAYARVKEPELHVAAHLLRPEQAALYLLVVDRRDVASAGAGYIEPSPLEQSERGFLKAALRKT